ncbi:MAG: hypothetical protein HFE90_06335 [Firmicutes bacterium]|nr:hypothetical protein [Bacillota bacterium]
MDTGRFGLKAADILNVYKAKNIGGEEKSGTAFAEAFHDCFQKKLSAENKEVKGFAESTELKIGGSEKLKDKYCSLCGSAINEDGSCPICIVPVFISGNGNISNQNVVHMRDLQTEVFQSK